MCVAVRNAALCKLIGPQLSFYVGPPGRGKLGTSSPAEHDITPMSARTLM